MAYLTPGGPRGGGPPIPIGGPCGGPCRTGGPWSTTKTLCFKANY